MKIYTLEDLDNQLNYRQIDEDLLFKQIEELEKKKAIIIKLLFFSSLM